MDSNHNDRTDLLGLYQTMWIGPFISAVATIILSISKPVALTVAAPILILWFTSPVFAWWISLPITHHQEKLTENQLLFLRKVARKTWSFFETFVGPDDHWLPPDNYQEQPVSVIAHRTSPTNMGLSLLANLSAHDFGYISAGRFIERTANTFHTMESMERHQGHFYNWYDTQSLIPLPPLYISTVDSGNLAGHLLTLRPGLLEIIDHMIVEPRFFEGLSDTLQVVIDFSATNPKISKLVQLIQLQKDMDSVLHSQPATLTAVKFSLEQLTRSASEVICSVDTLDTDPSSPLKYWLRSFTNQCQDALNELAYLTPWTVLLSSQNNLEGLFNLDEIPTLNKLAELDIILLPGIIDHINANTNPEEKSLADRTSTTHHDRQPEC